MILCAITDMNACIYACMYAHQCDSMNNCECNATQRNAMPSMHIRQILTLVSVDVPHPIWCEMASQEVPLPESDSKQDGS
jgi:hypothetical protein